MTVATSAAWPSSPTPAARSSASGSRAPTPARSSSTRSARAPGSSSPRRADGGDAVLRGRLRLAAEGLGGVRRARPRRHVRSPASPTRRRAPAAGCRTSRSPTPARRLRGRRSSGRASCCR
jgi:hypothetical protein